MSHDFARRTVTLTWNDAGAGSFHWIEADGTRLPLNRAGYSKHANALKALARFYAHRTPRHSANCGMSIEITGLAHPNREIAPRDAAFVDRMCDHDAAMTAKARKAAPAPESAPLPPIEAETVPQAFSDRWYVECRTLRGDVVRRHGPFAYGSADLSNAYHAEECAAHGHNRSRRHDDESCQRVFRFSAPAPAPVAMVPQPCQQPQAQACNSQQVRALAHGDLVRLEAWNHVTFAKVGTVEGYASENGDDPAPALARAQANRHDIAWIGYIGGALVNDGGRYFAEQKRKAASAITLTPGETVEMEGRFYRVRVLARCEAHPVYSDPIKLDPCEASAPVAMVPQPVQQAQAQASTVDASEAPALAYEAAREVQDGELTYATPTVLAECVRKALAIGWSFDSTAATAGDWPWFLHMTFDEGRCVKRDGKWRLYVETAAEALAEAGQADAVALIVASEDDGCPKGDPDCMGDNGDCHDACEAPTAQAGALRLWNGVENFSGEGAALQIDGDDMAHLSLLRDPKGELSDAEWIRWQAVIEAAPGMLAALESALDAWRDQFEPADDAADSDLEISGADFVDWFATWRDQAKAAVAAIKGHDAPAMVPQQAQQQQGRDMRTASPGPAPEILDVSELLERIQAATGPAVVWTAPDAETPRVPLEPLHPAPVILLAGLAGLLAAFTAFAFAFAA
jgi:hypothetical protein